MKSKKIALIYSFNAIKTAQAAKKIVKEMGEDQIDQINAEDISEKEFLQYNLLILGVPTWFDGELPNYWDEFVPALEDMDLNGKTIAIFGNGDQKGYPENFVDGIGIMAELLEEKMFVGLALDFENMGNQINKRIKNWVEQLNNELSA